MSFSVVVPSFRQGQFIQATLESLLSQNRQDLEILVYDGGSDDGTVEILKSYGDRIKFVSRPDEGQTDAIGQGLRAAKGDILAYLNSDDIYLPGALDRVARHFEENPGALVLYGGATYLDEHGAATNRYPTEPWDYAQLLRTCYICQPAVFWRREVMERHGTFDDRLNWAMDYEYWLRVGRTVRFDYLGDAVLAGSRLHAATKTLSQRIKVHEESLRVVMRYSKEPPIRWLVELAKAIVKEDKIPHYGREVPKRLRNAWIAETILEQADRFGFSLSRSLMTQVEALL